MKNWQKTIAALATFALLFNSISAPLFVLAQEFTPEPTPTPEATAEPTTTPETTVEPTATPEDGTTPTPDATPAETPTSAPVETPVATDPVTPVPTGQPTETQAPESNPTVQGPPSSDQPSPNTNIQIMSTPTVTPGPSIENGHLSATILENTSVDTDSIDQFDVTYQTDGSATISTDKLDYAPTDTAVITGVGFIAGKTYTINITSSDEPVVDFSASVTANNNGEILYSYTLDGTYRPNYQVAIKDSERIVATTTFTDGQPVTGNPSANPDQCANDQFPSPHTDGCSSNANEWIKGNVGANKAVYLEGDSIPYRMIFDNLDTSTPHTVTIEWDTTKGGKHALDYITTYNRTVATADPCLGVSGCGSPTTFPIPKDPQVDNGLGSPITQVPGNLTLFGGTITGVSSYTYPPNGTGFTGDNSARITITFTASQINPVLAWGGHIATRVDWGSGSSAIDIPGSPYHSRLIDLDGSGGNQDMSLSAEAVIYPASITIIKDATPNGSTSFSFTGSPSPLTSFSLVDDGTSANTHTFSNITNFQTYSINETPLPSGWGFDSVSCSVTSQNGGSYSTSTTTTNISVKEGESWTCTYLDSLRAGTLTVIKHVVNDNGGTLGAANFTLHVKSGSSDVTGSPAAGSESGTNYTLIGGTYVVSENTPPTGYTMTGFSGDCDSNGNVTVVAGQTKTCTITNNDIQPKLTVTKEVVNDNGGTKQVSDFPLFVGDTGVTSGVQNGFNVGTYTVSETSQTGYTMTGISGDCASNGSITLNVGDVKSCTITNNDIAPTLTLVKTVVNNNGGTKAVSDFPLFINGTPATSSVAYPQTANIQLTASETSQAGYLPSVWGGDCASNGTITLAPGDTKTCTITNDDVAPILHLRKVVVNDNGGQATASNFTLTADGTELNDISGTGSVDSGTGLKADTFALSEVGLNGYSASAWSCVGGTQNGSNITLALGQEATCTITNDDIAPSLTLVKQMSNNDGGNNPATDWTLTANGPTTISGAGGVTSDATFSAGTYTLSESAGPGGYVSGDWSCIGTGTQDGNSITLANGQNATCTIVNDDLIAHITLIKIVQNNYGGLATSNDFGLTIGGTSVTSGQVLGVNSNTSYALDELGLSGYSFVGLTGSLCPIALGGTVTLDEGGNITCTITNRDIQPQLTVIKHVINDNGGQSDASDFTINVTGTNLSDDSFPGSEAGTTITLNAGAYSVDEGPFTGYSKSIGANCSGTIAIGEHKTCTITNDDIQPKLTVTKSMIINFGGTLGANDFPLFVNGNSVTNGVENDLDVGTYTVTETQQTGYHFDGFSGDCDSTGSVTLAPGDDKTCTLTNRDIQGSLTIIKNVINDNGGDATSGSFTMNVTGTNVSDDSFPGSELGTTVTMSAGSFSVDEGPFTGYTKSLGTDCSGTIANGESKTCTITNDDIAPNLKLVKSVDYGPGQPSDWSLSATGDGGFTDLGNSTTFHEVKANTAYTLGESTSLEGYTQFGDWSCDAGDLKGDSLTLSLDQDVACTVTNHRDMGAVVVHKNIDINGDGDWDDTNETSDIYANNNDFGWNFDEGEQDYGVLLWPVPTTTSSVIHTLSENMPENYHFVSWFNTNEEGRSCSNPNGTTMPTTIQVNKGSSEDPTEITLCNVQELPTISIVKSNDSGTGIGPGSSVTYNIILTNSGNLTLSNIVIQDVLPGGFKYLAGSTQGATTDDPTVSGAVLSWSIQGSLDSGESINISYRVSTDSDLIDGTYTNFATCNALYGREQRIDCDPTNSNVRLGKGLSYGGNLVGKVLGASTELPATGSATWQLLVTLGMLGLGISMKVYNAKKGKKYAKN